MSDRVVGWARSETGPVRPENQDAYLVDEQHGLYVVADGVGGKRGGAEASRMLIDGLEEAAQQLARLARRSNPVEDDAHRERVFDALVECIGRINREIFERADGEMGTTCDVLLVAGDVAFIAHVGDSRIYLLRGGKQVQLTDDHTFAEQMKRKRREVGVEPGARGLTRYEHVLTRSIGGDPAVDIDTLFVDLQPGDEFILCTDGISDVIGEEELVVASRAHPPRELADHLVETALSEGTTDNATVVLVEIPHGTRRDFQVQAPIDTIRKVTFLEEVELFDGLDSQDLLKLMRIVYRRSFGDGDYIIREGAASDELYMILEGGVPCWRPSVAAARPARR